MWLPPQSPLVLSVRPSDVLVRLDQLYEWLVQRPQMYKENQEQTVQAIANFRKFLGTRWQFDPLTTKGWQAIGLDIKQPIYLGLYPLSKDARADLRQSKNLLKENIGAVNQPNYAILLERATKKPPALYKSLSQSYRDNAHTNGARLILPITDDKKMLAQLDLLGRDLGFAIKKPPAKDVVRVYHKRSANDPVVVVRAKKGTLLIDLLNDGFPPTSTVTPIEQDAIAVTQRIGFGRPFAPKTFDRPLFSIAMNQRGMAQWLQHETMVDIVDQASRQSADKRDLSIIEGLQQNRQNMLAWSPEVPGTSGVTYDLLAGDTKRILEFRMNLFGVRQLAKPPKSKPLPSLDVSKQSMGISLNTDIWTNKVWRNWLGMDAPYELKALLNDPGKGPDRATFMYWLASPVHFALFLTNINEILKLSIPLDFVPLYARKQDIQHIEMASYGDLSGFVLKPQFMVLFNLKDGIDASQRSTLGVAVRDSFIQLSKRYGPPSPSVKMGETLVSNKVQGFNVPAKHPMANLRYYFHDKDEQAWILVGHQLTDAQLNATQKRIKVKETTSAFARIELSSALQLLSTYQPAQLANLDLNILAQRLGPLTFEVRPREHKGVSTLEYTFTLMPPPSIKP